ncbi:MAG: hypothetical protein LBO62_02250 [Endomicrobium sp.]|jgi:tetratricopeptide (TPR) repeat protein|nr:hypothetical protein [Endomicrobium sp.]
MKAFLAENLGKNQNKTGGGSKIAALNGLRSKNLLLVFCLTALALITVFVFYPVLSASFINYDDQVMVSGNLKITSFSASHIKSLIFDSHFRLYHPIVNLSFAVEYMLFGKDPYIYHADNLILHLLNVLLVFFIFFELTRRNFFVSFITAAIFACHPLNVEAVAWISSRKDVLYAFFFLCSIYGYLKYLNGANKKTYYALSLISFLFACLSKPMAVTLPAILVLIDWFLGNKINLKSLIKYMPYFTLALLFSAAACIMYYDAGEKSAITVSLLFKNFVAAHFNVIFYLSKFIAPSKLAIVYPNFIKDAESLPLFIWLSPIFVWSLFAFSVFSLRYTKKIFFVAAFFAIAVLPVINILPAGPASVADRYVYAASSGLAFIAAFLIFSIYKKLKIKIFKFVFAAALCAVFCAMCFKANIQAKTWNNSLSVFNNQIKNYPGSSAMAYILRYYETQDLKDLYEAYRIDASLSTVIFALGYERQKAASAQTDGYKQALSFYRRLHKDDPNRAAAYIYVMEIYKELGDEKNLLETFEESVNVLPKERLFDVYSYIAAYYYEKREYENALFYAGIAKRIFQGDFKTYLLEASIYEKQNNFEAAFKEYAAALLNCGFVCEVLESMAALYFKTGEYALSARVFEKAVEINPSSFLAYDFLGNIAAINNNYKQALEKYTTALLIKNDFGQAYFHRAALYLKYRRYDKAQADASKAEETGFEVPRSFYEDIKSAKADSL